MTCKDCILFENCYDYIEHGIYHEHSAEEECKHFKDKSRFIELPCKVGDIVYFINTICDVEDVPCEYDCLNCTGVLEYQIEELEFDYCWIDNIGVNAFLTKEEAEKKLKEIGEINE